MNATMTSAPARSAATGLHVEREDIAFRTLRPGRLLVEVTVRNTGPDRTPPTTAILRSAPLGVFVPWRPLGFVRVPALGPDESVILRSEYDHEPPQVLGGIDKLPPERLLTALGAEEPEQNRDRWFGGTAGDLTPAGDLLASVQQGSTHWAGNLNLFFGGADVERHVAQALRVYPGCVNLAMFIVGNVADSYQFRFSGNAEEWNARLFDSFLGRPIVEGVQSPELREDAWHRPASGLILLTVEPPPEAEAGAVNVHVRQRSSGREAVVEFTMDSRAAGPGCYKL